MQSLEICPEKEDGPKRVLISVGMRLGYTRNVCSTSMCMKMKDTEQMKEVCEERGDAKPEFLPRV